MTSYSEPLSLRERRFAANQTIFRRANERFQRRLGAAGSELLPYVCECGHEDCNDLVSLLSNEYELIRVHASRFLIAVGHELLPHDLEQVVATHAGYQVVEKAARPERWPSGWIPASRSGRSPSASLAFA